MVVDRGTLVSYVSAASFAVQKSAANYDDQNSVTLAFALFFHVSDFVESVYCGTK